MLVPETLEPSVDSVDFGPDIRVVSVREPMPELGSLLAQAFDLLMYLIESSHDGSNGLHAPDIPRQSST